MDLEPLLIENINESEEIEEKVLVSTENSEMSEKEEEDAQEKEGLELSENSEMSEQEDDDSRVGKFAWSSQWGTDPYYLIKIIDVSGEVLTGHCHRNKSKNGPYYPCWERIDEDAHSVDFAKAANPDTSVFKPVTSELGEAHIAIPPGYFDLAAKKVPLLHAMPGPTI
jgi:hypothetical protein